MGNHIFRDFLKYYEKKNIGYQLLLHEKDQTIDILENFFILCTNIILKIVKI